MRFYLCETLGTGTDADPFRTAASVHLTVWDDIDARPLADAQIGFFLTASDPSPAEHTAMLADPKIRYINLEGANGPVPLDGTLSEVSDITPVKTFLETHHIPTDGLNGQTTIRQAIRAIASRFLLRQMLFSRSNGVLTAHDLTENLDTQISDIPPALRQKIASILTARGFDVSGLSGTVRNGLQNLMGQIDHGFLK